MQIIGPIWIVDFQTRTSNELNISQTRSLIVGLQKEMVKFVSPARFPKVSPTKMGPLTWNTPILGKNCHHHFGTKVKQKNPYILNRDFFFHGDFHPKVGSKKPNTKEQYKFKKNQFDCCIPRFDSPAKLFSLFDNRSLLLVWGLQSEINDFSRQLS